MSLPPELRVLCFQLSSTPVSELPRLAPSLLNNVLRCQVPLSMPATATNKAEASASAVLVHKLKTQLSTLLNGKTADGRFVATVLIKAVVETGGWEMLNGSESWVRGLLSILGKPDPVATKELAIMTLTKIYCMTHQYQTLIREITTPTLPTFVTAVLALITPKSSNQVSATAGAIEETIFEALTMLVPHHTSLFRPFTTKIRSLLRPYIAPTSTDGTYIPSQVRHSARRLYVVLHQTAAKSAGGEEWSKAVRLLIKDIHGTADLVFRAVVEDWESASGYTAGSVPVDQHISAGGLTNEDLPAWNGVFAGVERLIGMIELLAVYLEEETAAPVTIPIGDIMDMLNRMLSIAIPTSSTSHTGASARFHPAISRDERDVLYTYLPQVYVAALKLSTTMEKRLQFGFLPIAQDLLEQLVWVFQYGKHDQDFRTIAYDVTVVVLTHIGQSLSRSQVSKCTAILRSCYRDLVPETPKLDAAAPTSATSNKGQPTKSHNADTFLQHLAKKSQLSAAENDPITLSASKLLTLSLSHLPQQYVDINCRAMIERTAILTHNKDAMLASTLNPFIGKDGKPLASLLPYLTEDFGDDMTVEILLRPRMPVLQASATRPPNNEADDEIELDEDEEMLPEANHPSAMDRDGNGVEQINSLSASGNFDRGVDAREAIQTEATSFPLFGALTTGSSNLNSMTESTNNIFRQVHPVIAHDNDVKMGERDELAPAGVGAEDSDSDDESVHLTMALDTDSEDED